MFRRPRPAAAPSALAALSLALERVGAETTADAVAAAVGRELRALLEGEVAAVSRLEDNRIHEIAGFAAGGRPWRSAYADYAYLLADYPLTAEVLASGRPAALSLHDGPIDPAEAFVLREVGMEAVLLVPLVTAERPWGLVEVYDVGLRRFGLDDVAVAELVGRQAGTLLLQLDHAEGVQRLYRETLASLANALEEKDSATHDHTQEVVALAVDVGRELGLGHEDLDLVELGALFHDIGKIRVPESILNKPGPLDEEEWGVMRAHTEAGEAILAPITSLRDVLPIVRSSHERWDGAGYPDGLHGADIPVGARIVAVCDAYRAMTERRPYRDALDERTALAELRRNAGTQFDPECVHALLAVLEARRPSDSTVRLHRPARAA